MAAIFVTEVLKKPAAVASAAFLLSTLGQAVLLSRAGRWTDAVGRKPILAIGVGITIASQSVLLFNPDVVWFFVAMLLLGLGGAFMASAPSAVLGDVTKGHPRGPVLAASQMASDLGGVLGPLVAGFTLDMTSSYPAAFATGVALLLVSALLVVPMPETLQRRD